MAFCSIICSCFGHKWYGRGWTSDVFDKTVPPETPIANIWGCKRCGAESRTYETLSQVKMRFDGYREKYGDSFGMTDEFRAPMPLP